MSYTVLARKYRPRNFSELVGQAHVVQALGNALTTQRLHHAYLFTGTRGVGKTTISRILAKSLNCVGTDGQGGITDQPCGVCQACVDIDQGRFVDYTELDAASNRGVDEVQSLLEQAVYKPVQGRFKVFMIDEVHMLTNTAFNAMLKTLEEPPEYLKFVLATTDPQKVPVTVLSRCLQFNLRPMPPDTIVSHLEQVLADESVPFEVGALRYVARAAQGSMRDALSLTDQAIAYGNGALNEDPVRKMLGAVDRSHVLGLIQGLAFNEGARVVAMVDEARIQGLSAATLLEEMASTLQRMAVIQVTGDVDTTDPDHASLMALAEAMPADETQLLYSLCIHGRADLGLAPDEYAALTMVLLRLLAFKPGAVQASTEKKSPNLRPKPSQPREPQASALEPLPQDLPPFDVTEPTSDAIAPIRPEVAVVPDEVLEPLVLVPVIEATPDELMVRHTPSTSEGLLTTPEGDVWFTTVQRLLAEERVTALVRELALQAQLVAIDQSVTPAHWLLRIERESLNQGATRERLATALNEAGIAVTLAVELGLVQDTPAKRIAFAAEQKLADARAVMENDPFVRHMMRDFGAIIVPGTLKPQDGT
jgi:DNA polymerase-3 subunit gamma/tau